MWNKCDKCVSDKSLCSYCKDNPEVQKILASLIPFYALVVR